MTREHPKKKRRAGISFMTIVLSIALGIILSFPFKVISSEQKEPAQVESRQELASLMTKIQDENEELTQELKETREHVTSLESALLERDQASAEITNSISRYRILAGLDAVQGPGIRLTLSEDSSGIPQGVEVRPYLIHQTDLLNIVNELWLAGAEAIAIRSGEKTERLVLDSSIRCVGSLIDVNNTRMTPPFDIIAIGDPEILNSVLTMPGGVLEPLTWYSIKWEIVKSDNFTLPAFRGSTLMEYAKPLEESGE
ncbi:MAG TPA: DUF881 domain-containing protein [bacterium]|jgi:uncharacterized protein YlxW (UPF0749 family)